MSSDLFSLVAAIENACDETIYDVADTEHLVRLAVAEYVNVENSLVASARTVDHTSVQKVIDRHIAANISENPTSWFLGAAQDIASFLELAYEGSTDVPGLKNLDLLPVGHPHSMKNFGLTASARNTAVAEWVASDLRITTDEARKVVYDAYQSTPGSVKSDYAAAKLSALAASGAVPAEYAYGALIAAFNMSFAQRSAMAKALAAIRRRDRKGRFAEEFGRLRGWFKDKNGGMFTGIGRIVGAEKGTNNYDVEFNSVPGIPDGIYPMDAAKTENVKAVLSKRALGKAPRGVASTDFSEADKAAAINLEDFLKTRLDAPNNWTKNEDGSFTSNTGSTAKEIKDLPSGDFMFEGLGENNTQDKGEPLFEVKDANGDLLGVAQDWAGIQKISLTHDEMSKPEEEKKIAQDSANPLADEKPKKESYLDKLKPKTEPAAEPKPLSEKQMEPATAKQYELLREFQQERDGITDNENQAINDALEKKNLSKAQIATLFGEMGKKPFKPEIDSEKPSDRMINSLREYLTAKELSDKEINDALDQLEAGISRADTEKLLAKLRRRPDREDATPLKQESAPETSVEASKIKAGDKFIHDGKEYTAEGKHDWYEAASGDDMWAIPYKGNDGRTYLAELDPSQKVDLVPEQKLGQDPFTSDDPTNDRLAYGHGFYSSTTNYSGTQREWSKENSSEGTMMTVTHDLKTDKWYTSESRYDNRDNSWNEFDSKGPYDNPTDAFSNFSDFNEDLAKEWDDQNADEVSSLDKLSPSGLDTIFDQAGDYSKWATNGDGYPEYVTPDGKGRISFNPDADSDGEGGMQDTSFWVVDISGDSPDGVYGKDYVTFGGNPDDSIEDILDRAKQEFTPEQGLGQAPVSTKMAEDATDAQYSYISSMLNSKKVPDDIKAAVKDALDGKNLSKAQMGELIGKMRNLEDNPDFDPSKPTDRMIESVKRNIVAKGLSEEDQKQILADLPNMDKVTMSGLIGKLKGMEDVNAPEGEKLGQEAPSNLTPAQSLDRLMYAHGFGTDDPGESWSRDNGSEGTRTHVEFRDFKDGTRSWYSTDWRYDRGDNSSTEVDSRGPFNSPEEAMADDPHGAEFDPRSAKEWDENWGPEEQKLGQEVTSGSHYDSSKLQDLQDRINAIKGEEGVSQFTLDDEFSRVDLNDIESSYQLAADLHRIYYDMKPTSEEGKKLEADLKQASEDILRNLDSKLGAVEAAKYDAADGTKYEFDKVFDGMDDFFNYYYPSDADSIADQLNGSDGGSIGDVRGGGWEASVRKNDQGEWVASINSPESDSDSYSKTFDNVDDAADWAGASLASENKYLPNEAARLLNDGYGSDLKSLIKEYGDTPSILSAKLREAAEFFRGTGRSQGEKIARELDDYVDRMDKIDKSNSEASPKA